MTTARKLGLAFLIFAVMTPLAVVLTDQDVVVVDRDAGNGDKRDRRMAWPVGGMEHDVGVCGM